MRLMISAVGKLKDGAERELFSRYLERLESTGRGIGISPVKFQEIVEGRGTTAELRKAVETARLLESVEAADVKIVLDETGKLLPSATFAKVIREFMERGVKGVAFLIGGPDGHGSAAFEASNLTLSLSPMTLPHGLARIVLMEQLYRATTIIAGHPYHRV